MTKLIEPLGADISSTTSSSRSSSAAEAELTNIIALRHRDDDDPLLLLLLLLMLLFLHGHQQIGRSLLDSSNSVVGIRDGNGVGALMKSGKSEMSARRFGMACCFGCDRRP